ncbi:hypothetical protein C3489_25890 [Streptomyces sp. Ru71]|uniref:hypothetical protein n=1 Tax=Streptomyces sp. Ru71 TaxID=2080746 RepID=UPI000CDCEE92|nr:hypothetical protein [Streptomyces sp. Ru71]POX49004.1 hypothetical protein C3489_25890 [Streptomyces sp. Ru71]
MPGQRKRKRRQQAERQRAAERFAPEAGHWEVLFETRDEQEWHDHLRRVRAAAPHADWSAMRVDMLCGRLTHPTTYRLSRFVPRDTPTAP